MKIILHQKQVYFNANHSTITTDKRTLSTLVEYCEKLVNADRLPNLHCGGSIESTITKNGHRTRQTCGIFLSQIYLSERGKDFPYTLQKAVFVARSIRRNKAEFIRTNKASRFFAVVEALSHPLGNGNSYLLNKEKITMLFKFLFTGSRLRITVFANNLTEAYERLPLSQTQPVLIARLPVQGGIYA